MRTAGLCVLTATALALVGCAEPTQLVVVVRTDMAVPAEVDQVRVRVVHLGDSTPTYDNTLPLPTSGMAVAGFQTLLSFGAGPHDDDTTRRVQVLVDAVKDGRTLFTTEVRTGFARGKKLRLEIYLARRCLAQAAMCLPDQTCGLAGCVSPDVPVEALPPADSPPATTPVDPRPVPAAGTLPRLIHPLSLATATTQTPTFRFAPHPDADHHVLVLSQLRPVPDILERFDIPAGASSFAPPLPHPAGTYRWSVEAWRGATMLSRSATWELVLPSYSTVDRAWGTFPDVNGDGLGDLVAGDRLHLEVYLGGSSLTAPMPASVLHPVVDTSGHGIGSVAIGDVNGDGYGDVAVGVVPVLGGELVVYFGSADGVAEARSLHLLLAGPGTALSRIAFGGDVDGDGYGDVLVGAPDPPLGTGQVLVARGGAGTLMIGPPWVVSSADPYFGALVASLGPLDASGVDAFVVGSTASFELVTYVGTTVSATLPPATLPSLPVSLASGGDLQRAGPTVIVGLDPAAWTAELVGPGAMPALGWNGRADEEFGASVAQAGDFDGNGYYDVVIGAPGNSSGDGQAAVFLTNSSFGSAVFGAAGLAERTGAAVAGIGDFDGDGFDDIAVGAPAAAAGTGRVYVHLGTANVSPVAPPFAIDSVEPASAFGRILASR